ncbi:MAG: hypothetical protein SP4CHLAM5_02870 [Chlamydiia bacterium]|nr:hypothetical protein [Chlamydiia bacterium]MCH9618161.1 hypothetical protein [Chlamydiia bacterium]MCH9624471.1 hypothetical protein [Chlamydiia bacterium]
MLEKLHFCCNLWSMKKVSLIPYFSLAFFYQLTMPFFGSFFPVLYFAPFFTTCFSRKSLFFSLWASFFIGLFLDLGTTSTPLGFYPICTIGTALVLHRMKVYFLEDKPFPFSLYTALYSFVYTLFFTLFHSFYDPKFHLSFLPFLLDSIFLPMLDSAFHLGFFTLPVMGYLYLTKREQKARYLRLKKRLRTSLIKLQRSFSK